MCHWDTKVCSGFSMICELQERNESQRQSRVTLWRACRSVPGTEKHPASPYCIQTAPNTTPESIFPPAESIFAFSISPPINVTDSFPQNHGRVIIVQKIIWHRDTGAFSLACYLLKWFRLKRKNKIICSWEKTNSTLVSSQRDLVGNPPEKRAKMWLFAFVAYWHR